MADIKFPRTKRYKKQMDKYASVDCKHDSSLLPLSSAKMFYNFDISSGTLKRGYGVDSSPIVPKGAARYWVYRYYSESKGEYVDQYMYQYANGLISRYDVDLEREIYVSGVSYNPVDAINYRLNSKDVILLTCEGKKLITWDGRKLTEYPESPSISSMALHYERLFVTSRDERTKVFFSKNLDPTQWEIGVDGGGFIELLDERGFLNKVVSFGSYLYIFRDHGISRVTAYGDQTEFSVVNMFVTAGRIFPSSITTCGNCIMFMASDGLYVFDGYDCRRVLTNIFPAILPDDNCACAFFDGKYYLACRMKFDDGKVLGCEADADYKVNGLIIYDPSDGEYSISRGLDISFMRACSYNGMDFLMCCEGGRGGVIERGAMRFEKRLIAYWESGDTDFGMPEKIKHLTDVAVYNNITELHWDSSYGEYFNEIIKELDLSICVDGDWYKMRIKANQQNEVGLSLSGYKFAFSVETRQPNINAAPLSVKYSVYQ